MLIDFIGDDPYFKNNSPSNRGNIPRLIYARQMYILMMAMIPEGTNIDFDGNPTNNNAAETARGCAQWAINVVEFMDRDSIMTKFHFDPTPFNGWDPISSLSSSFVWGCERPELIITETVAGHDRRTEDLDANGEGKVDGRDPHFDQRLRPQGWTYVELYNPWTDNEGLPGEFYDKDDEHKGIDLTTRSPDGQPVWRLLIHKEDRYRDTVFNPRLEGPSAKGVYFVDTRVNHPADGSRNGWDWYRSSNNPIAPLRGGHYAVIGSRLNQTISRSTTGGGDGPTIATNRRIELRPSRDPDGSFLRVVNNRDDEVNTQDIRPVVAIVVDRTRHGQYGYSLTTPSRGYPNTVRSGSSTSVFSQAAANGEGAYNPPIDTPLDRTRGHEFDYLNHTQTLTNFRVIHLQRLADPTANFQSRENPFLTIDTMPVDLTVYNGITDSKKDPADKSNSVMFESRERGEIANKDHPAKDAKGVRIVDLYSHEELERKKTIIADGPDKKNDLYIFPNNLEHTLGYLNKTYDGEQAPQRIKPGEFVPKHEDALDVYKGAPSGKTFAWLTWLNRPYLNPLELMLVPRSSSQFLLRHYSMRTPNPVPLNPYTNQRNRGKTDFNHLFNFFYSQGDGLNVPELHRIFGVISSPSKFNGTETFGNPSKFKDLEGMKPPHNIMSNYREPGKVNINMIYDQNVWLAVANGFKDYETSQFWTALVASRRGYPSGGSDLMAMSPAHPSRFSKPFRSAGGNDFTLGPEKGREISSTLLRAHPTNNETPLFAFTKNSPNAKTYNDPDRSPFFRYEGMMRLNNMITTRSNVYAIWITMGYFEVTPDQSAPGGYALGQEIGSENNTQVRHRGFYMFDRSIPVACQPGKLNNVLKAVYIQRLIE